MIMGLMFVSCTGRFKDLNTDNTGITDEDGHVLPGSLKHP